MAVHCDFTSIFMLPGIPGSATNWKTYRKQPTSKRLYASVPHRVRILRWCCLLLNILFICLSYFARDFLYQTVVNALQSCFASYWFCLYCLCFPGTVAELVPIAATEGEGQALLKAWHPREKPSHRTCTRMVFKYTFSILLYCFWFYSKNALPKKINILSIRTID